MTVQSREASDAIVVQVREEQGHEGFREGLARAFVTGETADSTIDYLRHKLLPAIMGESLPLDLAGFDAALPNLTDAQVLAHHASRSALSLALVDCALRGQGLGIGHLLPPLTRRVLYSGVVTSGHIDKAVATAQQLCVLGMTSLKIKVGTEGMWYGWPQSAAPWAAPSCSGSMPTPPGTCSRPGRFCTRWSCLPSLPWSSRSQGAPLMIGEPCAPAPSSH